jgi:hypothetical protein
MTIDGDIAILCLNLNANLLGQQYKNKEDKN